MKNIIILVVLCFVVGCCKSEDHTERAHQESTQKEETPTVDSITSAMGKILKGSHLLKSFNEIGNDVYLKSTNTGYVGFMWQMNDSSYAVSILEENKIRYKIEEYITTPSIKFRWESEENRTDLDWIFKEEIIYAIVTCTDEQRKIWRK